MATINGLYITVESEEPQYEVEVTEQPVENGSDVADHIRPKAKTMNISGVIVGANAAKTRQSILNFMYAGTIVNYVGRNIFMGVIENFSTTQDYKIADGLAFQATFKEIRIAKSSYTGTLQTPIKVQTALVTNAGRKTTKTKAKKKGKSIWEA